MGIADWSPVVCVGTPTPFAPWWNCQLAFFPQECHSHRFGPHPRAEFIMRTAIVSTLVALSLTETRGQPTLPVWQTWSSNIASTAKIPNKLPQHRKGFGAYQVDSTRNMSAWIGDGQDYVADFNKQIVAFTECTAKDGCRCQYTCKLMEETACQSQLDGNALCGYDYEHRSKFVANVSVDGVETMHFHFADPLGPIPMAAHDVYVSVSNAPPPRAFFDPHAVLCAQTFS